MTKANTFTWIKTACGDRVATVGPIRYRVRQVNGFNPAQGPWFWVYVGGHRYTPTGRYDDAVSFPSRAAAQRYAELIAQPVA